MPAAGRMIKPSENVLDEECRRRRVCRSMSVCLSHQSVSCLLALCINTHMHSPSLCAWRGHSQSDVLDSLVKSMLHSVTSSTLVCCDLVQNNTRTGCRAVAGGHGVAYNQHKLQHVWFSMFMLLDSQLNQALCISSAPFLKNKVFTAHWLSGRAGVQ